MNKLTFLLTLKDRSDHTEIWLEHNLRPEYDYYVADGSIGDENAALFRDVNLPNLTYIRYPKDISSDLYIEKVLHAFGQIRTKYVMMIDSDDFINFHGIVDCIDALQKDSNAVCAGGPIYGCVRNKSHSSEWRYSLPVKIQNAATLHNRSGFDALVRLYRDFKYLYYSIYRTEVCLNIWRDINQLKISDLFLVEALQTDLTFCHGKYLHIKNNHYIRLANPSSRLTLELESNDLPHPLKIYFDDAYRSQVLRMSEHIAKLVGVDTCQLLSERRNYYALWVAKKYAPHRLKIFPFLIRAHEIIPRVLHIFFPIEFGIAFINIFNKSARR